MHRSCADVSTHRKESGWADSVARQGAAWLEKHSGFVWYQKGSFLWDTNAKKKKKLMTEKKSNVPCERSTCRGSMKEIILPLSDFYPHEGVAMTVCNEKATNGHKRVQFKATPKCS